MFGKQQFIIYAIAAFAGATSLALPSGVHARPRKPERAPAAVPSISILSPNKGRKVRGAIKIKGTASAVMRKIAVYDINRDYARVPADVTLANGKFSISIDSTIFPDGAAHLAVTGSTDQAGSDKVTIKIKFKVANSSASADLNTRRAN